MHLRDTVSPYMTVATAVQPTMIATVPHTKSLHVAGSTIVLVPSARLCCILSALSCAIAPSATTPRRTCVVYQYQLVNIRGCIQRQVPRRTETPGRRRAPQTEGTKMQLRRTNARGFVGIFQYPGHALQHMVRCYRPRTFISELMAPDGLPSILCRVRTRRQKTERRDVRGRRGDDES